MFDGVVDKRAVVGTFDGVCEEHVARGKRPRVGVQMRGGLHMSVQPREGVGDLPVRWMLLT
jgi:hypothetical protein